MAEQPALDAGALLAALDRHQVDCVLIGGMAVQAYGHVRTTLDLGARLRGVDADLLGIDLSDPRQLYDGGNFLMRTRHGDHDVFSVDQTAGAPGSYEQLRQLTAAGPGARRAPRAGARSGRRTSCWARPGSCAKSWWP